MIQVAKRRPHPTMRYFRPWRQALIAVALVVLWALALSLTQSSEYYPKRFAEVERGVLYRSAQPGGAQLRRICMRYGVRSVISLRNCRPDADPLIAEERAYLEKHGLLYVYIPSETPPSYAQMKEFLEKMKDAGVTKPVLVHCQAGRTRTGAAVALWRVLRQGWSLPAALQDADAYGLHDEDTIEMVKDFLSAKPGSGGEGGLAPLINRH